MGPTRWRRTVAGSAGRAAQVRPSGPPPAHDQAGAMACVARLTVVAAWPRAPVEAPHYTLKRVSASRLGTTMVYCGRLNCLVVTQPAL